MPGKSRVCEICQEQYRPTHGEQRTCGRACGYYLQNNRWPTSNWPPPTPSCRIYIIHCPNCGSPRVRRRDRSVVGPCSACARERQRLAFVSQAKPTSKPCADCGQQWKTLTQRNLGVCKKCQKRRLSRRFGKSDRARARRYGVKYEPIDRAKVYERDLWKCALCGETVEKEKTAPHPRSPSLDHIVPLSMLGPHTYANVQLAHFLCNSIKGDRAAIRHFPAVA